MGSKKSRVSSSKKTAWESSNFWATSRIRTVRDFYEALESVAWLWRVLGIFPMTLHDRNGKTRYESSKFYFIYDILIFAVVISNTCYTAVKFSDQFETLTLLTNSSILMRSFSGLLSLSFSNLWRIYAFKELCESINDLSEQNEILEKMSCSFDHDSFTKLIRTYVWTMFFGVMALMAWNTYITYLDAECILIEWIIWMSPIIPQTMDLTILGSLVGWLGCGFRSVNEKLRDVVARANTSSPKVVVTSNVCAESLRVLSKAHFNMCAIGGRINRVFNFSVLVIVTTAFLTLSTSLYFVFYELGSESEKNYLMLVWYVAMVLDYGIPIIVIVIICNWTSGQAMEAGKFVHEVRVEKADSLLYDAVKSFSLQLHHQKLEFTGAGFFPLNSSLLQTMAGTVITYFVILIQFKPKL